MGYLIGKGSSKILNVEVNLPILLTTSIISDIDLLIPGLNHRGPTHSIIMILLVGLPFMLVWRKKAIPYLAAVLSHPLLGDYMTSLGRYQGIQLLYPLTSNLYWSSFHLISSVVIILELTLFAVFLTLVLGTEDLKILTKPHPTNLTLVIPIATALLPALTEFPIPIPAQLIFPHLILIGLLATPILIDFKHKLAH